MRGSVKVFNSLPLSLLFWALLFTLSATALAEDEAVEREITLKTSSPVMVSKGSVVVLEADLDGYLAARVPPGDIAPLLMSGERVGQILENLVRTNALAELAASEGLLDTPANQARLLYTVARQAETIYRDHFLAEIELDNYEDRAREIYLTRPDDFRTEGTIDFDHLLLTVDDERSETEAMLLIVDLFEQLTDGADFRTLAEQHTDDPTFAENAGSYTGIDSSQLVPALGNALSGLKEGVWTDPIRSQFGWHLARLTKREEGQVMSWDQAMPMAIRVARQEHRATAIERLIRDIFDEEAVFAEGTIERLYRRYGVPTDHMIENPDLGEIDFQ